MERKKTLTMNWDGLKDDDDDDHFFESNDRASSVVPIDLEASSSEDEDFDDCRISFTSAVSTTEFRNFAEATTSSSSSMSPDYDIWMMAPGSITERRNRLLQGMGLTKNKELASSKRAISTKKTEKDQVAMVSPTGAGDDHKQDTSPSPLPIVLVRSRSDGDIESLCFDRKRKEELIGSRVSKQRLIRTYSAILAPRARMCPYPDSIRVSPKEAGDGSQSIRHGNALTSMLSNSRFGAFFLIKNLDTGKEFIVNEYNEDGMWNRLSDLQTGKQLTMEEFEKCVGYSPVVKELMRRENISRINGESGNDRKNVANYSYLSKSLRMSKRRGVALLKNSIKGVANSMSGLIGEKEREAPPPPPDQKPGKNSGSGASSEWIKVRQSGKSYKELSALRLCQEIQAHEGSIWTIRFNTDAHFLASAGEDRIIHVWEVQEIEVMALREAAAAAEGNTTPLHPSFCASPDRSHSISLGEACDKKKKGKGASSRKTSPIPEYVHVPETVFSLSEKPVCSFTGHLDDVLDLSWSRSQQLLSSSMDKTVRLWDLESKSCLKLFAHNDYVTCIHFNPMNDDYFISGSLDAKVRIWSIPDRQVVDWSDLHEMVTAACYTPDGQGALIGSHKGSCRLYDTEDGKLNQTSQIDIQNKKKSAKKITGFQFAPTNPSEVLVTSADSRVRILDSPNTTHKFTGFRNTSSQIAASFSPDGKYIISASEDSQVYVWRRQEPRNTTSGKRSLITTRSYEQFPCRDVSVAIPWPGSVRGEIPTVQLHSKRHSKRSASSQPTNSSSCSGSPTREETTSACANSKRQLPPLPKKTATATATANNNNNALETSVTPPEEDLSQVARTESGIGESFCSDSAASIRYGDSPSISAAATPSSNWSSSWSWFDIGGTHGNQTVQATAWGLVIVTAGLGGEIRAYQNFGLPRKVGRQTNLFGGPT
ncbi:hypothetical protein FNV43_RR09926 [Rhamnella rubrinervis]|uniref:WD repeat-containing protein 44 n=1 Tax=Rhamnella rubrinervis TaxID=2594499 RepID=A0A8K0MKM9_9ROSA|nr:hypothetical protein FNV43_RR09926 [Rhamnella rubrinervis]